MKNFWKEKVISIGIAILLVFFIGFAIDTFLERGSDRELYNMSIFLIAGITGIGCIVGGSFLKIENVGSGLIGGGILTVIYGIIRYWGDAENILRVIIIGIALGVLIWIGFKKHKDNDKKKKK